MINLIIPPVSDCFMPTLGVAQIAGYLKSNSIKCKVYDASAELFYNLVTSNMQQLGDRKFTFKNLTECLERFSGKHKEFNVKTDGFEAGFNWREEEQLLGYIEEENAFMQELEKLSFICDKDDTGCEQKYYGLSISYECQVVPALMLAKILKRKNYNNKICIGGSLLYNYESDFYKLFYASELIDILIVGAGEEALKYLVSEKMDEFEKLAGAKVRRMQGRCIIDTRCMKVKPVVYEPDYSDINFEYYPVKEKAFPYMIKDRCYYGKCHFCNGDRVGERKSAKEIGKAFQHIERISLETGVKNIYIVDAALSPRDLKEIVNLSMQFEIKWIANGRFEKQLRDENLMAQLSQKGCVMLRFGLESASQKVLDLMNKGVDISIAEDILKMTAKYGIKNHVYIMFGYPGEMEEDREMTLEFLERNKEVISSYSVSVFVPVPGTKIYQKLLSGGGAGRNTYKHMMDMLYTEERYGKIYKDISQLNDLLKNYTKTNMEYYSANIFNIYSANREEKSSEIKNTISAEEKVNKEISIQFLPPIGFRGRGE